MRGIIIILRLLHVGLLCPQSLVFRHLVSFQSLLNDGNYYFYGFYYAPNL